MSRSRRFAVGSAVTGSLLAAAFLPMAVAFADQYDFTPDVSTFVASQVEGYPPLINEVTGTEQWNLFDLTTNSIKVRECSQWYGHRDDDRVLHQR